MTQETISVYPLMLSTPSASGPSATRWCHIVGFRRGVPPHRRHSLTCLGRRGSLRWNRSRLFWRLSSTLFVRRSTSNWAKRRLLLRKKRCRGEQRVRLKVDIIVSPIRFLATRLSLYRGCSAPHRCLTCWFCVCASKQVFIFIHLCDTIIHIHEFVGQRRRECICMMKAGALVHISLHRTSISSIKVVRFVF